MRAGLAISANLPLRRTVHEPLAFHAPDADHGALTVGHLARVVLVVKFREIEPGVTAADAVVSAVDAALGIAEEALDRVRGR